MFRNEIEQMQIFNLPDIDIWEWTSHFLNMWNELGGLTHGIQIFVLVATIIGGVVLVVRVIRSFGKEDDKQPITVNVRQRPQRRIRGSRSRRRRR